MQGAPPGGVPRVAGELEPRDDHDRSRVRGPNLRRAAHPRVRRAGDRAGAARRGPADARRPDRAERRGGDRRDRRPRTPGRRFDRRGPRCHPSRRGPERLQGDDGSGRARHTSRRDRSLARPRSGARRRDRVPADRPALVHARRRGERFRSRSGRARARRRPQPRDEPGHRDPRGGVGRRVEGVRARGHARRRGQRRGDLLDRERRSDGRAHRRFDHGRARDDALRPGVPTDARRGARLHPGDRRGDRRVERPVRGRASHRPPGLDRDEPARLTFVGPGVEGDRFPDRQGRRAPRCRLHARRGPERHHGRHAGRVRADARLRRRQGAPVRVREVPRGRPGPVLDDEVRRRGHGDRPHLQGGARQGLAFARTPRRRPRGRLWRAAGSLEALVVPSEHRLHLVESALRAGWSVDEVAAASAIDPWFIDQIAQVAEEVDALDGRELEAVGRARTWSAPSGSACPTAVSRSWPRPTKVRFARAGRRSASARSSRRSTPAPASSPPAPRITTPRTRSRTRCARPSGRAW